MKNLDLVWFYNDDIHDVKGVGCGYRIFEIKTIGWKWVRLRPMRGDSLRVVVTNVSHVLSGIQSVTLNHSER